MPRAARALRARRYAAVAAVLALLASACRRPAPALTPAPPAPSVERLQREIAGLLAGPALEAGVWGIVVRSLARDDTLVSLNARKLLMPASSLKVATLSVAAERLGWNHTYETRLLATGRVSGEALGGDLVVVGSGDPSLMDADGSAARAFSGWIEALRARGIRAVTGRIIGDDRAFDDELLGAGWMWDDLAHGYSAPVGALQLNGNTTRVRITASERVGGPAVVALASEDSGLSLLNRVLTGGTDSASAVALRRFTGMPVVEVSGSIALGAPPVERAIAVANPTLHFVGALRRALIAGGIAVRGPAVDIDSVPEPTEAEGGALVGTHRSPPMSSLAVTLMKNSQNQYAETLLKTLGAAAGSASFDGGLQVIRDVLDTWGVRPAEIVLADGSGLSRYNLITPEALATILSHVYRDERLRPPFEASLPVAGRDGTLAARLRQTAAEGNVRAKSGSFANARSLAGYVTTADGEPLVFAIVANNYGVPSDAIDEVTDGVLIRLAGFTRGRSGPNRGNRP